MSDKYLRNPLKWTTGSSCLDGDTRQYRVFLLIGDVTGTIPLEGKMTTILLVINLSGEVLILSYRLTYTIVK